MKVRVLGSSAAWPIPRLGCTCSQCTSPDPRDRRTRSAILIDDAVQFDAGPDSYHQLQAAGAVPEVVLLTHQHYDHMLGLHDLAKLRRLPLWCTKETEQNLRRIFPRLDFRVQHVTPGVPIDLGEGVSAQGFDVDHSDGTRTLGYRITGPEGQTLVYIPDVRSKPDSKLARKADLLMLDGSARDSGVGGHLSMTEGVELAKELRAGRTLFTHIGHHTGLHAELEEWLPDGVGVAYDGLEFEL
jgi:phosphoribosyl 1,2-cyclic phosphate phosphodiesterase